MTTYILIFLAAFYKAVADTISHHFDTSVFKNMPFQFWNPNESYKYAPRIPLTKYPVDAWHLSNSFMIICFICAAVFYDGQLKWFWDILVLGIGFNIVFGLFYDYVLRRKPK